MTTTRTALIGLALLAVLVEPALSERVTSDKTGAVQSLRVICLEGGVVYVGNNSYKIPAVCVPAP